MAGLEGRLKKRNVRPSLLEELTAPYLVLAYEDLPDRPAPVILQGQDGTLALFGPLVVHALVPAGGAVG